MTVKATVDEESVTESTDYIVRMVDGKPVKQYLEVSPDDGSLTATQKAIEKALPTDRKMQVTPEIDQKTLEDQVKVIEAKQKTIQEAMKTVSADMKSDVRVVEMGPTISAHTGPGSICMAMMRF